jgi:hypothetical protein
MAYKPISNFERSGMGTPSKGSAIKVKKYLPDWKDVKNVKKWAKWTPQTIVGDLVFDFGIRAAEGKAGKKIVGLVKGLWPFGGGSGEQTSGPRPKTPRQLEEIAKKQKEKEGVDVGGGNIFLPNVD